MEWAYARGIVQPKDYNRECEKLIHQYKLSMEQIEHPPTLEAFMKDYELMSCKTSKKRLEEMRTGYKGEDIDRNIAQMVSDIVAKLLSTMDLLQMEMRSVDEIGPYIKDSCLALSKYPKLPLDFKGLETLRMWEFNLGKMKASDELSETDLRQLKYDLQNCYDSFNLLIQS